MKKAGYVYNHLLHVCDWLPTLYTAAGGNAAIMKHMDGKNEWGSLTNKHKGRRKEILHNIDPIIPHSALRVGDYKISVGDVGMTWDGWYPPWQNPADSVNLHVDNIQSNWDKSPANEVSQKFVKTKLALTQSDIGSDFDKSVETEFKYQPQNIASSILHKTTKSYHHGNKPVKIDCGPKPVNASTNCDPRVSPCLFNIATDPCEYNNIAADNKDLVIKMMMRLMKYHQSMVPPINAPFDPAGNPKYHNGVWDPWAKL